MSENVAIRRLRPEDAETFAAIRREALEAHPFSFTASPEDDRGLQVENVRKYLADEQQAVFGCFQDGRLSGILGISRAERAKLRHTAIVWGVYVAPRARRKGAGRALLAAAIAHARTWNGVEMVHLSVSEQAEPAHRMYEAAGFRSWGREPRAVQWQGTFADEFHMVLDLRADSRSL